MHAIQHEPEALPHLFADAPEAWALAEGGVRRLLQPGEVLIAPGTRARSLFVVLRGRLAVHLDRLDSEPLAVFSPGQHCGEVALIDGEPRTAWVIAEAPTEVLAVPELLFWQLVTQHPQIAVNALRSLTAKVRGGNHGLSESRKRQEEFRRRASFDALTGLHNRRGLEELLPRHIERAACAGDPLALVMVDVDHFKRFNDTHGHIAGDFALYAVGQRLTRAFRPTDLVARFGGEEFTVVLPSTTAAQAYIAADRARRAIEAERLELDDGQVVSVTASMGIASLSPGQSATDLLEVADRALYQAKGAGRNRVCAWGEVAPLPGLF